ncbi:MAG: FKBP-type peptidyl-prolyl cis-trans isomerase, partial [Phycisphaeraceae bacterium]
YTSPHDLTVTLADEPLRTFEQSLRQDVPPLIIEIHAEGEGDPCPDDALAHIAFVARFADGTEWDSSERRRITLAVPLAEYGVIDGLRAAITGMKVGETRRARIPWQLAYGTQGRPPIPARADLIFDIRLVAFEQPRPTPDEAP